MISTTEQRGARVLVTGGTGFIAQHCILALLREGYRVRTTVRTPAREAQVRRQLAAGGIAPGARLEVVPADLEHDAGWREAAQDCAYVLHGASPTPSGAHPDEDAWVRPAVEGNLRVLAAARAASVRRVVLTSAFGAICAGHGQMDRPFDETDWSDLSGAVWPYQKSKTLAERAAWEFIAREGEGLELSAINPVTVVGPVLGPDYSHSIRLVKNLLDGQPGCPRINSCFVDVRDVADLHVRAMTDPAARGQRFLASAGDSMWLIDVARLLRARLGEAAARVPARVLPDWLVRLAAIRDPMVRGMVPLLGLNLNASAAKANRVLGWTPRPPDEAILATATSLVALGLVRT